jgi:hypothetical protein
MSKGKNRPRGDDFIVPHGSSRGDSKNFFDDGTSRKPWFSFEYICQKDFCMKRCTVEQFKSLSDTLRILSSLEWKTISAAPKGTNGFEMIGSSQLNGTIPPQFKAEKRIMIFRIAGKKGRIAGVRKAEKFFVLFIDRDFTLYDHG